MSDAPRRLLILIGIFVVTAGALFLIRGPGGQGGYGLFDLLRGKALPEGRETHKPEDFTLPVKAPLDEDDVPVLARMSAESSQVAERVLPSVVSIATRISGRDEEGNRTAEKRLGAGVIVTPEGHVVTAYHVVHNFEAIVVRLANDRQLPVQFVGAYEPMDIAVLKIISPNVDETFPALAFIEDSDTVRQGEFAFSFGNPHGLRRSSDLGIISSKERGASDGSADLFQISNRLMPGHSGGPLVNSFGQIIGINRGNFGPDPWSAVGMAVVANDARHVLLRLLKKGTPMYGHLGVHIDVAAVYGHLSAFDTNVTYPLEVNSVTPGSAAEKAGVRGGDIITEFGGQRVDNYNTFKRLVRERFAGEVVSIGVRREGEDQLLRVTMAELDLQQLFARWEGWTEERAVGYIRRALGVDVANLSAPKKTELGLLAASGGVIVNAVHPRRTAEGILREGDVIQFCDGKSFFNAKQFVALLEQSQDRPERRIDLLVMRPTGNGARTNLLLEIVPHDIPDAVAEPRPEPAPAEKVAAPTASR